MKKISLVAASLALLTFSSLSAFATEPVYMFQCSTKANPADYVEVIADALAYDGTDATVVASYSIFKNNTLVESATNAIISGERLPVTQIAGELLFAFTISFGRSGSATMGYDVVNESWALGVNSLSLSVPMTAGNAICTVVGGSGGGSILE
jgi:hypothetical protein